MSILIRKILGNASTRIMFIFYVMIILISTFFVIFGYFNQLKLQEVRQYDKLRAIVTTFADNLNGDIHQKMMSKYPNKNDIYSSDMDATYQSINQVLSKVKKENKLNSPIYTLIYNKERDVFLYGVTSSEKPYFRHEYLEYPKILLDKLNEGGTIPKYRSENGVWLSAFHPIKNKDNDVVGVLEADIDFSHFQNLVRSQYIKQALISLSVIVLLALFLISYAKKILGEDQKQKEIIKQSHKEITDSINYAKHLQAAILPSFGEITKHLPNNFIYFKPKDVVSGDFYWFEKINGYSYIAAADCTGHGVPGAFMSVICSNALNRSVKEFCITDPAKILDKTRDIVIETFAKSGENVKDGMDIALCAFNSKKVIYSGANSPLWIVRKTDLLTKEQKETRSTIMQNGISLIEYKANKQPIGLHLNMTPFTQEEIDLHQGDSLYFFTDGFADQFGGEKGKKFKYKPFKRFLINLQSKPISERSQLLSNTFENWQGDLEQTDDICVVGVNID